VRPERSIPCLALRVEEAASALGVSDDYFRKHIALHIRWVRSGRLKVVAVSELERWLEENGETVLGEAA
jgi:excisionase family DNA binding protein